MISQRLLYSVRGMFVEYLGVHQAQHFWIPAYQRGYKWRTSREPDYNAAKPTFTPEVDRLLDDLWRAFEMRPSGEAGPYYYLQFLTLRPLRQSGGTMVLEVIDGQQRLTTLSLFFAVAAHLIQQELAPDQDLSFSRGKLHYEARPEFVKHVVYDDLGRLLHNEDWDTFCTDPDHTFDCDQQDVYYLFQAAHRICAFLKSAERETRIADFAAFVAKQGALLVNLVEEGIDSEVIFGNLNDKRLPLTDTELVKGLLLTRATRRQGGSRFQELVERRTLLGRRWDEISQWLLRSDAQAIFGFEAGDGLWQVLEIITLRCTNKSSPGKGNTRLSKPRESGFPLFEALRDAFNSKPTYHRRSSLTAEVVLDELWLLFALLQQWTADAQTHNLLGAVRVCSPDTSTVLAQLNSLFNQKTLPCWPTTAELQDHLRKNIAKLACFKFQTVDKLTYGDTTIAIRQLLTLLNVFPVELSTENRPQPSFPFDFARFLEEKWSLEHLFPQNPKPEKWAQSDLADPSDELLRLSALPLRTPDEEAEFDRLRRIQWEKENVYLHSIGNMALLTGPNNSGMGAKSFPEKREYLTTLIQQGSFVPPHTLSVFSKLLTPSSGKIDRWTHADIEEHKTYLGGQFERLRCEFPATTTDATSTQ